MASRPVVMILVCIPNSSSLDRLFGAFTTYVRHAAARYLLAESIAKQYPEGR